MSTQPERPSSSPDYADLYDGYWQRQDRFGSHSFKDAGEIAQQVLTTCGPGKLLDVGSGMGLLVRELLTRGIDAYGLDASRVAVDACNAQTPERFIRGSILAIPYPDNAFETVVSTDCLEHLAESDVPTALGELARICRGGLYLRIATRPDRDNTWHLTVRDRAWWEARLFEAGLRRHPLMLRCTSFASLEEENGNCTLLFERIPPQALHRFPATWLAENRDLHMDMLRESGRRSDAHIARYALAAEHVRPGDTVLDAACGMGYGAALLARGSEAARVIGVDNSEAAIGYARAAFSDRGVPTEFHMADATRLGFLADESVDLVACFETLEHVPDPAALLAEFRRVLTPGGRIIVSVPNNWADETGKDPNPHHLHVYTWHVLRDQLAAAFIPEKRWRQIAGGARLLTDRPRTLDEVALGPPFDPPHPTGSPDIEPEAEWWLTLGMKNPIGATKANYRETVFPPYTGPDGDSFNISAFARDYDNPWLFRSLICIGPRLSHDAQRERLAREVIATARPGSADHGGAVCVLAYCILNAPSPERIADTLALIEAFDSAADQTTHTWRWRISNRYIAARLHLLRGDRASAREEFVRCAGMDVLRFSPLLATKTIDAFRLAGVLSVSDGRIEEARETFRRGLDECRRVTQGPWTNIVGDLSRPQPYGMHEIAQVMDLGSRCTAWLGVLDRLTAQPGEAWLIAQRQSFSEMLSWVLSLQHNGRWLETQRSTWERIARERHEEIQRLNELHRADQSLRARVGELEAWNAELADAKAWHEEEHRKTLAWANELKAAAAWHGEQLAAKDREIERLRSEIDTSRTWTDDRAAAVAWHEKHRRDLEERLATASAELAQSRAWADQLATAVEWQKEQAATWEKTAARHAAALDQTALWGRNLDATLQSEKEALARARHALEEALAARRDTENRLAACQQETDRIARELRIIEESRNMMMSENSHLSAELGRVTSLPVHRFAMERWRNRNNQNSSVVADGRSPAAPER